MFVRYLWALWLAMLIARLEIKNRWHLASHRDKDRPLDESDVRERRPEPPSGRASACDAAAIARRTGAPANDAVGLAWLAGAFA
jgi:hypothetical protein